jgi:hypothetical protein
MKAFSVLAIVGLIIWAALFKSVVVVAFTLNKKEVVAEQCIQRSASENFCQGSCYLKEKLGLNKDLNRPQKPIPSVDFQDLVFLGYNLSSIGSSILFVKQSFTPYNFSLKSSAVAISWKPPRHV